MKTAILQSKSSTDMEDEVQSENRDSCYYPGCRKDANCNCQICLASINATLDLMPNTVQKSTLTKLSASKPNIQHSPIPFDSSILSTPRSSCYQIPSSPGTRSNARSKLDHKVGNEERRWGFSGTVWKFVLGLSLILSVEVVFSSSISGIIQPVLSPDVMKRFGEQSGVVKDLNGKLRFLQKELQAIVDGKVSNCSNTNSVWEISQDGLLLNSRCTLFKTALEEIAVWGWPLQTAGLLASGYSFQTLTILSGRVTEWPGGGIGYLIRKANTSWVHPKWGASAVQLDPNTWILEYRRSSILDNTSLYSAALEFLKYRVLIMARRVNKKFWLSGASAAFEDHQDGELRTNYGTKIPT